MPVDVGYYLRCQYQDGGRGMGWFDCWGLVRHVLHYDLNHPLFSSFGHIRASDKRSLTVAAHRVMAERFEVVDELSDGVVLLAYRRKTMVHIGVCVTVDGMMKVLHAAEMGIRLESFDDFERNCNGSRVVRAKYSGV